MEKVFNHLSNYYGLPSNFNTSRIERGYRSSNYLVDIGQDKYFLKGYIFNQEQRVSEVQKVQKSFSKNGISTVLPISTIDSEKTYFTVNGSWYALFPFIEDRQIRTNEVNMKKVKNLALMSLLSVQSCFIKVRS